MVARVTVLRKAKKQLRKVPWHVSMKLKAWIVYVEKHGLEMVRRHPGFHDEALLGARKGERSIRLSQAYRAIYRITSDGRGELVEVQEVSKHGY